MTPKTEERLISFRKNNRKMPRRRLDVPLEKLNYRHPEIISKFTTETGKILPRRVTGVPAWLHRVIVREIKRARAINLMP